MHLFQITLFSIWLREIIGEVYLSQVEDWGEQVSYLKPWWKDKPHPNSTESNVLSYYWQGHKTDCAIQKLLETGNILINPIGNSFLYNLQELNPKNQQFKEPDSPIHRNLPNISTAPKSHWLRGTLMVFVNNGQGKPS